ncbi:helix-turn-helix domain-containing protein [Patescibacteria group bacterium]|nr:helix-turn-helix domain-containing protein [Patescibacteria group bacterium]
MEEETLKYIFLQKAAEYCSYSQEYLSLLARKGKLKAIKIGNDWVTKREWVEEYVERIKTFNNRNNQKKETSVSATSTEQFSSAPTVKESDKVPSEVTAVF